MRSTREIVSRCEASIAKIEGSHGHGTGFVAAPRIIATNAHVINRELPSNLKITFPSAKSGSSRSSPVRLVYEDRPRDLALLEVETTLPPLELAHHDAFQRGEDVVIIGNPGGLGGMVALENAVTRGILSTEAEFMGQRWYQLSMSVNPGNSGGPVIDTQGRVVGIVTLKAAKEEGHGYCIPVDSLAIALKKAEAASPRQRLDIERRHKAQSIFQVYYLWAKHSREALFLLILAREPVDGQPIEPAEAGRLFGEAYRSAKRFDSAMRTDYSDALREIGEDPNLDEKSLEDLQGLDRIVGRLGAALKRHETIPIDEARRTLSSANKEVEQLRDRLCVALDMDKEKL